MKRYVIAAISCLALIVGVSPPRPADLVSGASSRRSRPRPSRTRTGRATRRRRTPTGRGQGNDQSQTGYGGDATSGSATSGGSGCCGSGGDATSGDAYGGDVTQSQEAANTNSTTQEAHRDVTEATQVLPVNVNVAVCLAQLACQTGDVDAVEHVELGRRVGVERKPHRSSRTSSPRRASAATPRAATQPARLG